MYARHGAVALGMACLALLPAPASAWNGSGGNGTGGSCISPSAIVDVSGGGGVFHVGTRGSLACPDGPAANGHTETYGSHSRSGPAWTPPPPPPPGTPCGPAAGAEFHVPMTTNGAPDASPLTLSWSSPYGTRSVGYDGSPAATSMTLPPDAGLGYDPLPGTGVYSASHWRAGMAGNDAYERGVVQQQGTTTDALGTCSNSTILWGFLPTIAGPHTIAVPPIAALPKPAANPAGVAAQIEAGWHAGPASTLPSRARAYVTGLPTCVHIPQGTMPPAGTPVTQVAWVATPPDSLGQFVWLRYTVTVSPNTIFIDWGDGSLPTPGVPTAAPPDPAAAPADCVNQHTYEQVSGAGSPAQGVVITVTQSVHVDASVDWFDGQTSHHTDLLGPTGQNTAFRTDSFGPTLVEQVEPVLVPAP